jgi:hypothetical protein
MPKSRKKMMAKARPLEDHIDPLPVPPKPLWERALEARKRDGACEASTRKSSRRSRS